MLKRDMRTAWVPARSHSAVTYTQIAELSAQTSMPLIQIIRALVRNAGNTAAAREALMNGDSNLAVADSPNAENPAARRQR